MVDDTSNPTQNNVRTPTLMGKGILIFVMASTLSLAMLYMARTEQDLASVQTESDYQEKVLARQTAQSAFNLVISKVRNDPELESWVAFNQSFGGGLYDVGVEASGDGTKTIIAVGKVGSHEFEIIGSMIPQAEQVTEAISVGGGVADVSLNNNSIISGEDVNPDGENVHAVMVSSENQKDDWVNQPGTLKGKTSERDVVVGDSESSVAAVRIAILNYEHLVEYDQGQKWDDDECIDSDASSIPVIVVRGDVKLDDDFHGSGILLVEGKLELAEGASWHGVVMVTGETSSSDSSEKSKKSSKCDNSGKSKKKSSKIELKMGKDTRIQGAVFLEGIDKLDMKGNNGSNGERSIIQYDSSVLDWLRPVLNLQDDAGELEVVRQLAQTSFQGDKETSNTYVDETVETARAILGRN